MLRIKALRLARGFSQWELSRLARMSQGRYSMVERGLIQPLSTEREAIARILQASGATLFRKAYTEHHSRIELTVVQE